MKTLSVIFLFISLTGFSQRWQDQNRGLFPSSLQITYNFRNTATGLRYGYLFQNAPLGLYAGFSQTIAANLKYNTYPWERRFTAGGSLTVPNKHPLIHLMFTFGSAYNWHEDTGNPGQFDPDVSHTNNWGIDIGLQAQIKHIITGFDLGWNSDIWYCQMRFGVTFNRLRR
jgi:hypothetical protein